MNNQRRKTVEEITDELRKAHTELEDLVAVSKKAFDTNISMDPTDIAERQIKFNGIKSRIDDLKNQLENPKDEEQESFDNMPEGLQQGERGSQMEENISNMEEALDSLQSAIDALDNIQ